MAKIVPIDDEMNLEEGKHVSTSYSVTEAVVSLCLRNLWNGVFMRNYSDGFVRSHEISICRGRYSPSLYHERHRWLHQCDSTNLPETNVNMKNFDQQQFFNVFMMEDGGTDLEHFFFAHFCRGPKCSFAGLYLPGCS